MDPQLKCFIDENKIEIPPEWGLPSPNPEAAYKSMAKYAKSILPMSDAQVCNMNLAWEFTTRHFGLYMSDAKVLDYEDAKARMDMSTSCGAPFSQLYKTKAEMFAEDPNIDSFLREDWETLANNSMWTALFTNSLKEELRTEEKIDANSIRTFTAGGVDMTLHGTRLFVDMNEKMYASHLKSSAAVGMSPYYGNWHRLFLKLKSFRKGYALDESAYDSSLRTYMMWGCALLRWKMLALEHRTLPNLLRIKTYYRNLIWSLIIGPNGVIVMKQGGNPSGSVNTISDNTLVLYTLLAYAWISNAPEDLRTYEEFEQHTAKALVGDDNTWTVSDTAHEFFNARTVIHQWNQIGVTTTTDSLEPRKAEDLDFLSAHTIFIDGVAVPVYSRVKLMTSLLYAPKEGIGPAVTLERAAALLSVGWTDLVFRRFCRKLIRWLLKKFDDVLFEDARWITAKTQIKDDSFYYRLFTGRQPIFLRCQSFGACVKWSPPNKNDMSRVNRNRRGVQPRRRRPQQQPQQQRKAPEQRAIIVREPKAKAIHPTTAALHTLAPCSVHYLQALEAPFSLMAEVCIPDMHAVSSKKVKVLTRGTFETSSTTGVGWITLNPWRADSVGPLVAKTSASYTGSEATVFNSVAPGVTIGVGTKFPYPDTAWGLNGISHRIVGVGLRVRYTGIELYRGGRAIMIRMPDNKQSLGNESVASLFGYSQAKSFPVTNEWTMVAYKPVRPAEFEYSDTPGTADVILDSCMVYGVSGTAGPSTASAIFEYEVVTHVEYIGEIDAITVSHSDVVGMSQIRNATMRDRPTKKEGKAVWSTLKEIGNNVLNFASPLVEDSIKQGATQSIMSGVWDAGKNALSYLGKIPGRIEAGAYSALRNTFSGGLLDTLGGVLEGGAMMLL
jgi:hypothetical protein